jgi:mono/diheme cytochrome c family protein
MVTSSEILRAPPVVDKCLQGGEIASAPGMKLLLCSTIIPILMPFSVPAQNNPDGAAIFQEQCIGCHGPDGRAQTDMGKKVKAADLTSGDVQKANSSSLEKIVKSGKDKMPSFDGKLSDDEIKSVVAYVKQLGKSQ